MKGKRIIVGITGGIAAYKVATVVREMKRRGAEVRVVMTPMAKQFITPLTMATLSQNPIAVDFFDPENGAWNSHVSLGLWADAYLIAPATANTLGKMANGIADNLLLTTYLSAKCPVFVAPSMDLDMYAHEATQHNISLLKQRGVQVIDAEEGFLASGLSGKGRMAEPEQIVNAMDEFFFKNESLRGKRVLITAGPTYEKIDPVRFIGNYSSGKMGYAIAEECAKRGAEVILVSGPVKLNPQHPNIRRVSVESAQEMFEASVEDFPTVDFAILSAAVADYSPVVKSDSKIKREKTGAMQLNLSPTKDIAAHLGTMKKEGQLLIGFALETDNEFGNATEKCKRKNFDFIVLNSLRDKNAGFQYDTNKITIIDKFGTSTSYDLKPKSEVAKDILDYASQLL
jgi:phosphopantothenoylcysteine decarboxylase/phosphopantothenate--cysteine ligase